jgi:hypothetical protein
MTGAGVGRWLEIANAEARGRTFRLRSIEIVAHAIGGRWGVLALYLTIGIAILGFGVRGLRDALRNLR